MSYWVFDNIGYGIRAKFLKYDKKSTGLYGSYGWTIGSVCALAIAVLDYQKHTAKCAKKYKAYKEAKSASGNPDLSTSHPLTPLHQSAAASDLMCGGFHCVGVVWDGLCCVVLC